MGQRDRQVARPTEAAAPHALDRTRKLDESVRSVASIRCPAEIRLRFAGHLPRRVAHIIKRTANRSVIYRTVTIRIEMSR